MNINPKENKRYLMTITIIAALGGFLFGYDTAVISGTISMVKEKFSLNLVMEGWYVSSALVGCIMGVAMAGELSDRYGRKVSLIVSGFLFSISAIGCAVAGSHAQLIFFRLMGGIGVGIASMLSPLYISEISPADRRGRMVALYQFAITVGILCAYFGNAFILDLSKKANFLISGGIFYHIIKEEAWRGMLGSEAIPAFIFFVALFFVPRSPRWYASKGKFDKAEKVLARIYGNEVARQEVKDIKIAIDSEVKSSWASMFRGKIKIALFAGMILALLCQFTGINAIIYYGPRIMESAGLQLSEALGGQVIIGIVNVVATIFALWKIDQYGRKNLMMGGITGMFVSLLVVGLLFFLNYTHSILFIVFILTFIASFAIGYGPVIWVLLSEIYPTMIRGRAMSVATLCIWVGTAIIGQVVPWMLNVLTPAWTFFVFALFCIPVPLTLKLLPETKGKTLEEIEGIWLDREKVLG
jgi:MFS transporter, SP family, arabinose:H+ symporter